MKHILDAANIEYILCLLATQSFLFLLHILLLLLTVLLLLASQYNAILHNMRVRLQMWQCSFLTVCPFGDVVHFALHQCQVFPPEAEQWRFRPDIALQNKHEPYGCEHFNLFKRDSAIFTSRAVCRILQVWHCRAAKCGRPVGLRGCLSPQLLHLYNEEWIASLSSDLGAYIIVNVKWRMDYLMVLAASAIFDCSCRNKSFNSDHAFSAFNASATLWSYDFRFSYKFKNMQLYLLSFMIK